MKTANWEQTEKQARAWEILNDQITTELLFGGGAGGAKSFLGAAFLIIQAGRYAGSRWLMGRSKLKTLKETTLVTFFDVCKAWGIRADEDFVYHIQDGTVEFSNGSLILMKDLFHYPSDPEYDSLGSLEVTGGFIDEVNQIPYKGVEVAKSRIRYKLNEWCSNCDAAGLTTCPPTKYDDRGVAIEWKCWNCGQNNGGLIPKLLMTCNPAKNWVKSEFYDPAKKGTLEEYRRFLQALVTDNPYASQHYLTSLKNLKDKATRERLLHGNWDYDDDPSVLIPYDAIVDLFTNQAADRKMRYITGDAARKGRDKMVFILWEGWQVLKIVVVPYEIKSDYEKAKEWVINFANEHQVRRSNILIDEDGVGGGLVDSVRCQGFINNGSPIQPYAAKRDPSKRVNYANLKSQCYFHYAQKVENGETGISDEALSRDTKDEIAEELSAIKQIDADKDGKLRVNGKDVIKEEIGRSPDFADALMMRSFFELSKRPLPGVSSVASM